MFLIDDNIEKFRRIQNINRGKQNRNNLNSGIRDRVNAGMQNRYNVNLGIRDRNNFNIRNRYRNNVNSGRSFDRQNIRNSNFGGLRREIPFQENLEKSNIPERDLTMANYNPYLYLHPSYDDSGNLIVYNSVNALDNLCKSKCLTECAGKDLNCVKNCYDLCIFDENRGLDGDSLNYKESFMSKKNINDHYYYLLL